MALYFGVWKSKKFKPSHGAHFPTVEEESYDDSQSRGRRMSSLLDDNSLRRKLSCIAPDSNGFTCSHNCDMCKRGGSAMMTCPCRRVIYCSVKCQSADWDKHQIDCTGIPTCLVCGKTWLETSIHQCYCRKALFCGVNCQKNGWPEHQLTCPCHKINEEANSDSNPAAVVTALLNQNQKQKSEMEDFNLFKEQNEKLRSELELIAPWLMDGGTAEPPPYLNTGFGAENESELSFNDCSQEEAARNNKRKPS